MQMKRPLTVGIICARGGSKGVVRKNLRLLGGKPLLAWSIEVAKLCPSLDRIVVSTEDEEIAAVAKSFGAEVPFARPADLARDDSPELQVWQHAIRTLRELDGRAPDLLVSIPTTSPLRAPEDVEACISELRKSNADLCLTVREAQRNPYFNMVTMEEGWAKIAMSSADVTVRRQDAPKIYEITTVAYAAKASYVMSTARLLDGQVRAVIVPEERSLDIDSELDLQFAEFLFERRGNSHRKSI